MDADAPVPRADHAPVATGPWLVADIGGTHARFGCIDDPSRWRQPGFAGDAVGDVMTLACADHEGPLQAARAYLALLAQHRGRAPAPPTAAAFAVATAVTGDRVAFTNSGWAFSRRDTERALALPEGGLRVINDFEAQALSLPLLGTAQRRPIGAVPAQVPPRCAMAVVGPGTGLGVGAVVPVGAHGWVTVPGEGGHATLAAADEDEAAVLAAVRRAHAHVSAERLLSGMGLPVLHAAVATLAAAPTAGRRRARPDGAAEALDARAIVARGVAGSDAVCARTLALFCALLGSFAGNVTLTLGARSGLYLGGGILPRMADFLAASAFRERFEAKGRFRTYLRAVPTYLITDTLAALTGAAQSLAEGRGDDGERAA